MRGYAQKYNKNALVFIINCPSFSQLWRVFCSPQEAAQAESADTTGMFFWRRTRYACCLQAVSSPLSLLWELSPAHSFCVPTARSWKLNEAVIVVRNSHLNGLLLQKAALLYSLRLTALLWVGNHCCLVSSTHSGSSAEPCIFIAGYLMHNDLLRSLLWNSRKIVK